MTQNMSPEGSNFHEEVGDSEVHDITSLVDEIFLGIKKETPSPLSDVGGIRYFGWDTPTGFVNISDMINQDGNRHVIATEFVIEDMVTSVAKQTTFHLFQDQGFLTKSVDQGKAIDILKGLRRRNETGKSAIIEREEYDSGLQKPDPGDKPHFLRLLKDAKAQKGTA